MTLSTVSANNVMFLKRWTHIAGRDCADGLSKTDGKQKERHQTLQAGLHELEASHSKLAKVGAAPSQAQPSYNTPSLVMIDMGFGRTEAERRAAQARRRRRSERRRRADIREYVTGELSKNSRPTSR